MVFVLFVNPFVWRKEIKFIRRHILAPHYGDWQGTQRCVSFKPVLCVYSLVEAASVMAFA